MEDDFVRQEPGIEFHKHRGGIVLRFPFDDHGFPGLAEQKIQRDQSLPRSRRGRPHLPGKSFQRLNRKLLELAKVTGGKVVTNDYALNRLAGISGVAVLNINELANSLKPVVLPGESMQVHVVKEGKEVNQGVAYLDDGTMVVVDHGKRFIGHTVDVTVTTVLQTTAGRMIFVRPREEDAVPR